VPRYLCGKCGYIFDESEMLNLGGRVMCPKCGYKVIYKVQREFRVVKAL